MREAQASRIALRRSARRLGGQVLLSSLRLRGAVPREAQVVDHDGDGIEDVWARIVSADIPIDVGGSRATMSAMLDTQRPLYAEMWFTPVPTHADEDGDGVVDECDQCSATPAGQPVGEDGCP